MIFFLGGGGYNSSCPTLNALYPYVIRYMSVLSNDTKISTSVFVWHHYDLIMYAPKFWTYSQFTQRICKHRFLAKIVEIWFILMAKIIILIYMSGYNILSCQYFSHRQKLIMKFHQIHLPATLTNPPTHTTPPISMHICDKKRYRVGIDYI